MSALRLGRNPLYVSCLEADIRHLERSAERFRAAGDARMAEREQRQATQLRWKLRRYLAEREP